MIYITDTVFRDMYGGDDYGLIYIYDDYTVIIDNCTFENNLDFTALVHCRTSSNCRVNISNSVFDGNIHGYYAAVQIVNGIVLEENAYGKVYIE